MGVDCGSGFLRLLVCFLHHTSTVVYLLLVFLQCFRSVLHSLLAFGHAVFYLVADLIQTRSEWCKERIGDAIKDRAKRTVFCSKGVHPAGGVQRIHQFAHFTAFFTHPCFQLFPCPVQHLQGRIQYNDDKVCDRLCNHVCLIVNSVADNVNDCFERFLNIIAGCCNCFTYRASKQTQHCQNTCRNGKLYQPSCKCTKGLAKVFKAGCEHGQPGCNGRC